MSSAFYSWRILLGMGISFLSTDVLMNNRWDAENSQGLMYDLQTKISSDFNQSFNQSSIFPELIETLNYEYD